MHLTPSIIEAAYDFLSATPPFNRWSLPPGDEIGFHVGADPRLYGWYVRKGNQHIIGVSVRLVSHTNTLLRTTAHEMVHLRQALRKSETAHTEHNAEFIRLAARVCAAHGFDPKEF